MGSSQLSRNTRGSLKVAPDLVAQGQHLSETQAAEGCWSDAALITWNQVCWGICTVARDEIWEDSCISLQATGCVSGWFPTSLCLRVLVSRAHRAWEEKGRDAQTTGWPHRLALSSPGRAIHFHPEQETIQTLGPVTPLPKKYPQQVGWEKCHADCHVSVGIVCCSTISPYLHASLPRGTPAPLQKAAPHNPPAGRMGFWKPD